MTPHSCIRITRGFFPKVSKKKKVRNSARASRFGFVVFSYRTQLKRTSTLIPCGALPLYPLRKVQEHNVADVLLGTKIKGYLLPIASPLSFLEYVMFLFRSHPALR